VAVDANRPGVTTTVDDDRGARLRRSDLDRTRPNPLGSRLATLLGDSRQGGEHEDHPQRRDR
jgi:hypothetical protein